MNLQEGVIIKSTEALNDSVFAGAIILITESNANGAVGFVINKPFGRSLNELEEYKHSSSIPLYDGGPVEKEHLYFIHKRPDLIEEGTAIKNGLYFGGNFRQAVAGLDNKSLSSKDIKIFVGYCGWDGGELEEEIAEGSWIIAEAEDEKIFG